MARKPKQAKTKLDKAIAKDEGSVFYNISDLKGILKLSNGSIQFWADADTMIGER